MKLRPSLSLEQQMLSSQRLLSYSSKTLKLKTFHSSLSLTNPRKIHCDDQLRGLLRGFHGDSTTNTHPIPQDIDELCKILSRNHYNSQQSISFNKHTTHSFLDDSGVNVVTVDLVEQVLKKLTNSGALALSFFQWAEQKQGFDHTTGIYNALIDSLGKIKQFQLSDLNCLLGTLCKSKNVRKAQEVFDEMVKRRKRFVADLKTYTVLLERWHLTQRTLENDCKLHDAKM